jgi:hypothetical protein
MLIRRIVISAVVVAGSAAVSLSPAQAQYYPPCSFPLEWPFCVAGAAVNTAAAIATAPFRAVAPGPYYAGGPYYYGRPYYAPAYYYPRRHRHRRHHYIHR